MSFHKNYNYFIVILKFIIAAIISSPIKLFRNRKNIWLFAERGKEARDNAYNLFVYTVKNHPEIESYFIIDKKSPDFNKISNYKTINYGSFKHYYYFCLSKVLISTHILGYSPNASVFRYIKKRINLNKIEVFLQHGVIKDNLEVLHYPNVKLDLFVCGAKPEYEYVINNFGHNKEVIQYLGLARFDNFHDLNLKKQILLMPTWRIGLNNIMSDEEFVKSDYFIKYNIFINNKDLANLLEKYGYKLIFYPHFRIQKYISAFHSSNNKVIIASLDNYDIQELLKESQLLITDYSSVFFDFGYMKKPVIYYQFDMEYFRKTHYKEGYFSYENNGFGPVYRFEGELMQEIERLLKSDCKITDLYKNRIEKFFPLNDTKNCERNFIAIKKLIDY